MGLLVATSAKTVLPDCDELVPATLEVDTESGKIVRVLRKLTSKQHDYPDLPESDFVEAPVLLPGQVDAHVHLNEPGRTEWEGFRTGTLAAASGGVTTVVDMPLNSIPPTTTVENLRAKTDAAEGQCATDVAFWGGVVPGNAKDLKPLVEAGVKGFKCFLCESGVEEFKRVEEKDLLEALPELEGTGARLLFHAELAVEQAESSSDRSDTASDPRQYSTFLSSRRDEMEVSAIELVCRLQAQFPTVPMHIVHLSSVAALPPIREARKKGLPLTVETCHHYLCLASEHVPAGSTVHKCCPPIRSHVNRDGLWEALAEGDIDYVVSDHSPCTADLKKQEEGDFQAAWGGIGGLGLGLSLLYTEGKKRDVSLPTLMRWLASRPAEQLGLNGSKGSLTAGADGDFAVFDDEEEWTVSEKDLLFKNKVSPYLGARLEGRVLRTFLRGREVFRYTSPDSVKPSGRLILS